MEWLIVAILIGLIPAAIAKGKGRSFGLWWFYGSALFIVALPHALIMAPDRRSLEERQIAEEDRRKCPFCAELVKREATVCRFCQRDLPSEYAQSPWECPRCKIMVPAGRACKCGWGLAASL